MTIHLQSLLEGEWRGGKLPVEQQTSSKEGRHHHQAQGRECHEQEEDCQDQSGRKQSHDGKHVDYQPRQEEGPRQSVLHWIGESLCYRGQLGKLFLQLETCIIRPYVLHGTDYQTDVGDDEQGRAQHLCYYVASVAEWEVVLAKEFTFLVIVIIFVNI